uniref:Tyrosyl-DNA phosphodiesterase 2 n=1 Tax=Eptatretus burgeri TaxID=7764 RepID=A0A8C4Q5B9_EPTBU
MECQPNKENELGRLFADVTSLSQPEAIKWLQKHSWNLQKALDSYFEFAGGSAKASKQKADVDIVTETSSSKHIEEMNQEGMQDNSGCGVEETEIMITIRQSDEEFAEDLTVQEPKSEGATPIVIDLVSDDEPSEIEEITILDDAVEHDEGQLEVITENSHFGLATVSASNEPDVDDGGITMLSWNIDGLDLECLPQRSRAICNTIALHRPDVVCFQEVIDPFRDYLAKHTKGYHLVTGGDEGYYTAILLKKSRLDLLSHEIIPYPTTRMMRNLLIVKTRVFGLDLCLMTSHLESTRACAKERQKQLKCLLEKIHLAPQSSAVIFAGDTNLRDKEVSEIGGLPWRMRDMWVTLGSSSETQYTWDTSVNDNLGFSTKSHFRFDRIYFRAALDLSPPKLLPRSLRLVGTERLMCKMFPSDHWGLLAHWDLVH